MRTYIVEIDESKPATRLIDAATLAGASAFVAKQIISVRLATQADMYEAAKKNIEIEDSSGPIPANDGQAAP